MKAAVIQFAASYDHQANLKKAYLMADAAKKQKAALIPDFALAKSARRVDQ